MQPRLKGWSVGLGLAGLSLVGCPGAIALPVVVPVIASSHEDADRLFQQGVEFYETGNFNTAIAHLEAALDSYRAQGQIAQQLATWVQLSAVQLDAGHYREAIASATEALELAQADNDSWRQLQSLGNLAIAYGYLGEYLQALQVHQQALDIAQDLNHRQAEGQVLSNLASTYEMLGDYRNAIAALNESLAVAEEVNDEVGQAVSLSSLGAIAGIEGDYPQAIAFYEQSLAISQRNEDRVSQAHTLMNLGIAYHNLNEISQAQEFYEQGLAIAQEFGLRGLEVLVLSNLGIVYEDQERIDEAIASHQQAVAIAQELNDPRSEGISLNNLGHTLLTAGRLNEAEAVLWQAIDQLEALRPTDHDAYNISTFDTHVLSYNLLQQILVAQGNYEEALVISERGRARAFVERLFLQHQLEDAVHPELLSQSVPSLEQIRRVARTQNATIVEYSIVPDEEFKFQGRQRGPDAALWIWVVQPTGEIQFRQVDLTALEIALDELVTETRYSIGVRTRSASTPFQVGDRVRRQGEPSSWEPYEVTAIDAETGDIFLAHPDFALLEPVPASDIYRVEAETIALPRFQLLHELLIAPIADLLPTDPEQSVIFVPTEELFLVPFPALQNSDEDYLIEQHTILTAPSIQVLDLTRPVSASVRDRPLIVGNPSPMPNQLTDLPYAETEAQAIAQLLDTESLLGRAATESSIRQQLESSTLIHFATHGLFNENNPLQGAIAFAPDDTHDGLLTAEELLNYRLDAQLVVLSACETGQGEITGDGVVGLSRSLMTAGVPSVVVSLWQVPDEATSQLMTQFYEHQRSRNYAQSLRHAMLTTLEDHPNPYHWAAFTLIGRVQ